MRDMAEMKRLIECLEGDGYFSRVQTLASEEGIPLKAAYCQVEALRVELGMRHRFTSVGSFYVARSRFHASGGEIFRLQEDEE